MVGEAPAMVEDAVAAATSVGLPGIALRGTVSSAMASHNAKEGTLGGTKTTSGTEIISGTGAISLLEIPFGMITPYYGYGYPYFGYYDQNAGDYSETITAVQKQPTQLGYYHGYVDGLIGPETEAAIRWFQSVDKLPVTGRIDDPTLKALRIS